MSNSIRLDRFFVPLLTLDIDGKFNEDTLLSLRANQTRLLGVGNQDFIIDYRNTLLKNRNVGYNIPESFDLSWNFKTGPIINPNQILPCYFWIKPEDFVLNEDQTKVVFTNNRGKYGIYSGDFYFYEDEEKTLNTSVPIGPKGDNNYKPLAFDGNSYLAGEGTNGSDVVIAPEGDFIFGCVIKTNNQSTNAYNDIVSAGRDGTSLYSSIYLKEINNVQRVGVRYFDGGEIKVRESEIDCYSLGSSFILVIARINNVWYYRTNGFSQTQVTESFFLDLIDPPSISESLTFVGASADIDGYPVSGFQHNLYEAAMFKPIVNNPLTVDSMEVIEGYFAEKYKLKGNLSNLHAYKTETPRTYVIERPFPTGPVVLSQECDKLEIYPSSLASLVQGTTQEFIVTVKDVVCPWSATTSDQWITLQNATGTGNGSFVATIQTNSGEARSGSITVLSGNAGSVVITITQEEAVVSDVVDATGGTETTEGSFVYHTFTSDATLEVLSGGEIEYIVVAGGGGGSRSAVGGGGGAGGAVITLGAITPGTYSVVVGSGGAGAIFTSSIASTNGQNSTFNGITAIGGGAGGGWGGLIDGNSGGSGGGGRGAVSPNLPGVGGSGTAGQGFSGGSGSQGAFSSQATGGGGGGAGEAGNDATTSKAGDGGDGVEWPIGTGTYYAGGGGGTRQATVGRGLGGLGGGGDAGDLSQDPTSPLADGQPGTPNTGGGGGSGLSDYRTNGGDGGSGVVIIRYTTDGSSPSSYIAPSFTYVPTIGEPE
jgi:hypothetical protein